MCASAIHHAAFLALLGDVLLLGLDVFTLSSQSANRKKKTSIIEGKYFLTAITFL